MLLNLYINSKDVESIREFTRLYGDGIGREFAQSMYNGCGHDFPYCEHFNCQCCGNTVIRVLLESRSVLELILLESYILVLFLIVFVHKKIFMLLIRYNQ